MRRLLVYRVTTCAHSILQGEIIANFSPSAFSSRAARARQLPGLAWEVQPKVNGLPRSLLLHHRAGSRCLCGHSHGLPDVALVLASEILQSVKDSITCPRVCGAHWTLCSAIKVRPRGKRIIETSFHSYSSSMCLPFDLAVKTTDSHVKTNATQFSAWDGRREFWNDRLPPASGRTRYFGTCAPRYPVDSGCLIGLTR